MKTAYFSILKTKSVSPEIVNNAVGIAIGQPKYVNVAYHYKQLAPSWNLLSGFRDGRISEQQYIEQFNSQLSKLNPQKVYNDLCNMTGSDEPVLMCHCGQNHFCHRHLVADWLEKSLGLRITEVNHNQTVRENGYCKNIEPQNELF